MAEQASEKTTTTTANDDKGGEQGGKIEIDTETYQALLDKLDDLEEKVKGKGGEESTVDRLAREAQTPGGKATEEIDLDALSQTALATHMAKDLGENLITPLLVKVEELKLELEIDRLTRETDPEGKTLYSDFWDYKDAVYKIAAENPNLSIKKAYQLAKGTKTPEQREKETKEAEAKAKREERLRHLPEIHGERPGATEAGTETTVPTTTRGAAEKAADELGIK